MIAIESPRLAIKISFSNIIISRHADPEKEISIPDSSNY